MPLFRLLRGQVTIQRRSEIDIAGIRIDGTVNLAWAKLRFPLRAYKCAFTEDIILDRASLRSLLLQATSIKRLHGDGLTAEQDILLSEGFQAQGEVSLKNARIEGSIYCDDGKFINSSGTALGSVVLKEVRVDGLVELRAARIGAYLICSGGQFCNPGATALDAKAARIELTVYLDCLHKSDGQVLPYEAEGKVDFTEARIGDRFVWRGVTATENSTLDLRSAKAKTLLNEEKSWPEKLFLNGFVFDELDDELHGKPDERTDASSAHTQIKWIRTNTRERFIAQPYDQMAEAFRKMGRPEDAVEVMVAKNKDAGKNSISEAWKAKGYWKLLGDLFWYKAFGKLICFGYNPWPALHLSLLLVLLGAVLFELGFRSQIVIPTDVDAYYPGTVEIKDTYPKFNALIYSLETFVPLVKLGVGEHWMPNASGGAELHMYKFSRLTQGSLLRAYFWIHIIAGWILTTLWVGGLTGLIKT